MEYMILAAVALVAMCMMRRVVRFTFRLVVLVGVLALCAGVLKLNAQENIQFEVRPAAFFRLGAWDAVGNTAGAIHLVAAPGHTDFMTIEIFLGSGAKMDFTGTLYGGTKARLARTIAAQHGLPGADVICGMVALGYEIETMCIIFALDSFDGYTVAGNGSKHYVPVLQVGLVVSGKLIWSGTMRTDSRFVVDANGRVVW